MKPGGSSTPGISILKPLAGADLGLESNLRTFFEQDYPSFEILFAVRREDDPALPIVRGLQTEYPAVPSRLLIVGEPPYPNAKVFSLDAMTRAAHNELLVMSDSDIRVTPGMLRVIAAEFSDGKTGLATCPYRAVAGPSFWTRLEAVGMNTQFLGGMLAARMLEGMKFAVGPTIAARKSVLAAIGGFDNLKDYLAEDFVMGKLAFEAGFGVILSAYVIEHHIGSQPFLKNVAHRLRWHRSTRCSRPKGYVGEVFTNPLPIALLLLAADPRSWPLAAAAAVFRYWSAWWVSVRILHEPLAPAMILLQDCLSFLFWIGGFFGNTIDWRGIKYRLNRDGRFHPIR